MSERIVTWAQFKASVEAHGVQDEDKLLYIDWDGGDEVTVQFRQQVDGRWVRIT